MNTGEPNGKKMQAKGDDVGSFSKYLEEALGGASICTAEGTARKRQFARDPELQR